MQKPLDRYTSLARWKPWVLFLTKLDSNWRLEAFFSCWCLSIFSFLAFNETRNLVFVFPWFHSEVLTYTRESAVIMIEQLLSLEANFLCRLITRDQNPRSSFLHTNELQRIGIPNLCSACCERARSEPACSCLSNCRKEITVISLPFRFTFKADGQAGVTLAVDSAHNYLFSIIPLYLSVLKDHPQENGQ